MSNILLCWNNRVDAATLSQGSWTAGLPVTNLQDTNIDKVARSSNAAIASTRVLADLGALYSLRALSIVNHNFTTSAQVRLRAGAAPFDADFTADAVDTRLTTSGGANGTAVSSAGVIGTARTTPRIDFDPAAPNQLAAKGLLVEPGSTNLLLNSTTLATQSVSVSATPYTLSFYGTGSVTLSGASTGSLAGINGATRVTLTFTPSAGTLTLTVSGSVQYAQVEASSVATSWISTAGATVTRTADSVSLTGAAFSAAHNAAAGTLYAEFEVGNASTVGTIASINDGTNNNKVVLSVASGTLGMLVVYASGTQANISLGPVSPGVFYKVAVAWSAGDFAGSLAGAAAMSSSGGTVPTVDRMFLGADAAGGVMAGWLKRVTRWTTRLSNQQLQSLSTSGPGAVDFDSGWVAAKQLSFVGDVPSDWGAQYNFIQPFNALTARYLTLEVADTGNSAGYVQMGRVFVGNGFQPGVNAELGLQDGREDLSTLVKSRSGKIFSQKISPRPRWTQFHFPYLTPAEGDQVHEIEAAVGLTDEVLYVPDPADLVKTQRYGFLGLMHELSVLEYPQINGRAKAYRIDQKL